MKWHARVRVVSERTSVTTDATGRRVLAKVARNAEEAALLEREAAQLEAARHPGVVELVGVDGHGVGSVLLTAHVEGPTAAHVGPLPLEEAAGLVAALASTLADLHDLGLVHGAVAAEHVVIGPGGRAVLCSLAYGGRAGQPVGPPPAVPPGFTDPVRVDANVLSPAFDVFGLGALTRGLAPSPPQGHPLAAVAADATADDPSARPSARAVAEALQQNVPAARLPRGLPSPPPARPSAAPADPLAAWRRQRGGLGRRRPGPARPRAVAVLPVVVAVGVVAAAVALAGSRSTSAPAPVSELAERASEPSDRPSPDEGQPGPTTTRAGLVPSSTTTSAAAARSRTCPSASAVLQADIDGDGCPEALRYADGILEAGVLRWSVGQPGDQVATGDWACQGTRTLALFRPSTGEIFRFDGWAGPDRDLTATAVGRVQAGQALRAADVDRDGCHEAVVERATGVAEVIIMPRRQR